LTRRWDQPIVVAPIGSPRAAVVSALGPDSLRLHWAGSALALTQAPRAATANKGSFGHVLVVGGTMGTAGGKSGAPAMAALAALRAGAGLVTAAVPAPALELVAAVAPELMTFPLAAIPAGEIAAANLAPEVMTPLMAGKTVLAIGPGLGQSPQTVKFTTGVLFGSQIPAVIDADALNILAAKPSLLAELVRRGERTLVLTPHPGEMARLAGITVAEVQANRLEVARGSDRPSRWQRGREHQRQSRHGQGRQRRPAHRAGGRVAGAVSRRGGAGGRGGRLSARIGRGFGRPRGRSAHLTGDGYPCASFSGFSLSLARSKRVCLVAGAAG
jgi:hydroxyethylthiazole kinase-like uncharacterized protein yjeF